MDKSESHDLVAALKDVAIQMGKTPTRAEFISRVRGADYRMRALFGNYTALVQAAGLQAYRERGGVRHRDEQKIDNRIFERDLAKHLEQYAPRSAPELKPYPSIAVISDIHWPFASERVITKFLEYVRIHKPEHVIINGDAWDLYSHSKYPRSHNIFTPREEQKLAREANEKFWKDVKAVHPEAKCVQMLGNHDIRPLKRVMESYPEAEDWIAEKLRELFSFEGVTTIHDPREELVLGDVLVFHGYRSQLGAHRDYTLYSCVNGHTHRGGVVFRKIRGAVLFEGNSGVAGDPESKGLSYTPQKIQDWTPGVLAIDAWGPRFIPA